MAELHVAHLALLGLLGRAQRVARDAAAHVLEADRAARHQRAAPLGTSCDRELADDVVLDVGQDVVHALVFVVMGVDVDDQHVVELALKRLLPGVREQPRGVELLDGDAPAAIGDEVHDGSLPIVLVRRRWRVASGGDYTGGKVAAKAYGLSLPGLTRQSIISAR
jgi:hypothetical protein